MSKNPEEPRPDAFLKQKALDSHEFGEQLYKWCIKGLAYARAQLKNDGIELGGGWLSQLSEFKHWWFALRQMENADTFANNFTELLKTKFPNLTSEHLSNINQLSFTLAASNNKDPEEFREMEYLRLAKETAATKGRIETKKLELAERRVELLEKKAKEILGDTSVPIEQREARMKAMFGIS